VAPFGLFKKKDREEAETTIEAPASGTISMQEAQAILQSIESAKAQALVLRLSPVKEAASASLRALGAIAGDMEKEKIKLEELEKRFGSTAENSKKTVVAALRREVSSDVPAIQSAADAKKFKERMESMMNRFGEVSGSHSRMINYFMKKQADRMRDEFETLTELVKETKSALAAFEQDRAPVVKCNNTINTISQKIASIKSDTVSAEAVAERIAAMEQEAQKNREELAALKSSPEFARALAAAEKMESVKKRVSDYQSKVSEMFSHVSRAFTKYSYGVSKETERRLHLLADEPWKIFYEQDITSYSELLHEVGRSVGTGQIQLKDSDKILHHLQSIQSSLEGLHSQAKELAAELAEIRQGDIAPVQKARDLEESIARYNEQISRDRQSLEQQKRQISEKNEEVNLLLIEVADGLYGLTGKRYVVVSR
jgi:DNA repair exonuclease SbcCD ATPase subunit